MWKWNAIEFCRLTGAEERLDCKKMEQNTRKSILRTNHGRKRKKERREKYLKWINIINLDTLQCAVETKIWKFLMRQISVLDSVRFRVVFKYLFSQTRASRQRGSGVYQLIMIIDSNLLYLTRWLTKFEFHHLSNYSQASVSCSNRYESIFWNIEKWKSYSIVQLFVYTIIR